MIFQGKKSILAENIGDIADIFIKKNIRKPTYANLFTNWNVVVGSELASKAVPFKIMTQGDQKILVLKSKKGCSTEIQHCSLKILENVNHFLGESVFSFIKVIQMDFDEIR
ncbi:MAG: DUF721 domain-containing protein [Alphaproteobacteria bacterium]|nr:DUF721 domain-containing protein [Alphaproteobacteria bacterium]